MGQQAVVVQHGAHADDVGIAVSCPGHRAEIPPLQLAPAFFRQHLLVVFDVVQQDQVRPPGPVAAAPQLLPGAGRVDAAAVLQQDDPAFPHLALLGAEPGQKGLVVLQLGLDAVQKGRGLAFGVGHQQDVLFVAVQSGVEHILQGHDGGFGVSPGRRQCQTAARRPQHGLQGVRPRHQTSHHPLLPKFAQLSVKRRRRRCEIMAQIPPPKGHGIRGAGGVVQNAVLHVLTSFPTL